MPAINMVPAAFNGIRSTEQSGGTQPIFHVLELIAFLKGAPAPSYILVSSQNSYVNKPINVITSNS